MNKNIVEGPQFVKKSYPKMAIVRNMNLETSKFNGEWGGGGGTSKCAKKNCQVLKGQLLDNQIIKKKKKMGRHHNL